MIQKSLSNLIRRFSSSNKLTETTNHDTLPAKKPLPIETEPIDQEPQVQEQDEDELLKDVSEILHQMTEDELSEILDCEDNFIIDRLLNHRVPKVKKMRAELRHLKTYVTTLAAVNHSREPEYVRERMRAREMIEQATELSQTVDFHKRQVTERINKSLSRISNDAKDIEEKSELLSKEFLDKEISIDEFLPTYIKLRKRARSMWCKIDKMNKDLSIATSANVGSQIIQSDSPKPTPRQKKRQSLNK